MLFRMSVEDDGKEKDGEGFNGDFVLLSMSLKHSSDKVLQASILFSSTTMDELSGGFR